MEIMTIPKTEIGYWIMISELRNIIQSSLRTIIKEEILSIELNGALNRYSTAIKKLEYFTSEVHDHYPDSKNDDWEDKMKMILRLEYEKNIEYIGPRRKDIAIQVSQIEPCFPVIARSKIFYWKAISFRIGIYKKPL